MVRDSCGEQASSLDTENMSNVVRNTNCRKKGSPGMTILPFLEDQLHGSPLNEETGQQIEVNRSDNNI